MIASFFLIYVSKTEENVAMEMFDKARRFIYRNARPIDLFRFQFLFENGSKENVVEALKEYQNSDGGFAYALEPDCWNEKSTPLQTWVATRIIEEIGSIDKDSELVQGIIKYLCSGNEFSNGYWKGLNGVKSNNNYPHAIWWSYDENASDSYNPTASLAGFLLKYAEKDSDAYMFAANIVQKAVELFTQNAPIESMHEAACFVELYEYLKSGEIEDVVDMAAFRLSLEQQINYSITKDTSKWNKEYICKPSLFIKSSSSSFYEANKDICDYECKFITECQNADGTWNITWDWTDYLEQWSISKNWWRSDVIINNLKILKNYGHLN